MLSPWDQYCLIPLVYKVDVDKLLVCSGYECAFHLYNASRESISIEVNFVDFSSFEAFGCFNPELFPAFGFSLYALLCANVIISVCRLYAKCDNFVSDMQIKIFCVCYVLRYFEHFLEVEA